MAKFNQQALDELKRCKERIETEVPKEILNKVWLATSPERWFSNLKTSLDILDL